MSGLTVFKRSNQEESKNCAFVCEAYAFTADRKEQRIVSLRVMTPAQLYL